MHKIKKFIRGCEKYKQFHDQYRKGIPIDTYKPDTFNFITQIDSIGSMETRFQKKICLYRSGYILASECHMHATILILMQPYRP